MQKPHFHVQLNTGRQHVTREVKKKILWGMYFKCNFNFTLMLRDLFIGEKCGIKLHP